MGSTLPILLATRLLAATGARIQRSPGGSTLLAEYDYRWEADAPAPPMDEAPTGTDSYVVTITDDISSAGLAEVRSRAQRGESAIVVSAEGVDGPFDGQTYDLLAAHAGGYAKHLVWSTDRPEDDPPRRAVADQMCLATGMIMAFLATMLQLVRPSPGLSFAVSARDVAVSLLLPELGDRNEGILSPTRARLGGGSKVAGGLVGLLESSDGHVLISPREQHQWDRLMTVIDDPELAADPRFATVGQRQAAWETLQKTLQDRWSRALTSAEIFRSCQAVKVACFPLGTVAGMLDDSHLAARGFWSRTGPTAQPGLPFRVLAYGPAPEDR